MRILRLILVILATILVLALVLLFAAQTPPVRRYVLRKASAALRSRGIDFHASSLRYNLFTLHATLTGVVVRSAEAPNLPPLATIPRIDASAHWGDLLHGRLGLASVTLVRPTIDVVREPDGRDNFPHASAMSGGGSSGSSGYFVDNLAVRGATLRVIDPARKLSMTLPWQLEVHRNRHTGSYALRLTAGNGPPIHYAGRSLPFQRLQLSADLRGERLIVNQLQVQAANSSVTVSGSLAPISGPTASLSIQLRANAAQWARILGLKQRMRGELEANLAAVGPLSRLKIYGTLRSAGLAVGSFGAVSLSTRILLDAQARTLAIQSANVALLGGSIHGQGRVALTSSAGASSLTLQFAKLDLARLSRALKLPARIASRAKGTAGGHWPALAFSSGTWKAAVDLTPERTKPAPGIAPIAGSLSATLHNGNTTVQIHGVHAMGAQVSGRVALASTKRVHGTLHADVAHLNGLLASLGAYLGRPPPLQNEHLHGRASIDATIAGSLSTPQIAARFALAQLQIGRPARKLPALEGRLTLHGQQAHLSARAPSLGLTADARATLRAPYPIQVTANLPKTSFAAFPVKPPAGLQGTVSLSVNASGNLQNWRQADATIQVKSLQGHWRGIPLGISQPAEIRYSSGKVGLQAALQVKDSSLTIHGALPLSGGPPGDVRLQGSFSLATLLGFLPQKQRPLAEGRLEISGDVRGNLRRIDPSIDVTLANGRIEDSRLHAPLTALSVDARLRGAIVELRSLSADWAGGTLKGSGSMPLAWLHVHLPALRQGKQQPVALSFSADGIKLQSIHGLPKTAQGEFSLRAKVSAARPELRAVHATLTVPRMEMTLAGLSFREPKPAKITLQDGVVRIEQFALEGPRTSVTAGGTAHLFSPRVLDVKVDAKSNAAILASMSSSVSAQGPVELHLSVKGTPTNPRLSGFLQTRNVSAAIATPQVVAQDMNVRVNFSGSRATIAQFKGFLNGGQVTASGGLSYAGGGLRDVNVQLKANGISMQYPQGLNILANAKIDLRSYERVLNLGGQVTVVQGSYRRSLNVESLVPLALGQKSSFTPASQRNALLDRLRFNLGIGTRSPIIMDNNLGKLAIAANLQLTGGYYNMGLLGRMTIEQGGTLRLNERTYTIDTGTVTFTGAQSIEASPDIVAKTQAAGYSITLQVTKEAGRIRTNLTSQPPLSQANIISVLLTGRTIEEARGQVGAIAQQEALSYLAGRLGQTLSSQVQGGLGLTTVRLEPSFISAESSPGARLMVGQNITPRLNLSYSVNLANTGDQIWAAQYDITHQFTTQAVKQSDNSYRFEMRQHLNFGGAPPLFGAPQKAQKQPLIGSIQFTGSPHFPVSRLKSRLKVKTGQRYDFLKVHKGVERLQKLYADQDFLEASVRTVRSFNKSKVNLRFHVDSGLRDAFSYTGWTPSKGTRKKVRQAWKNGAFEEQRRTAAVATLRGALVRQGYLQASVTPKITKAKSGKERKVAFRIQPGARYHHVQLVFQGAGKISPSQLEQLLKDQNLLTDVYLDPSKVTRLLESYYNDHGYLAAHVGSPRYELKAKTGTGQTVIPVHEGPRFRIGKLNFQGNKIYSNAQIAAKTELKPGEPYLPKLSGDAANRIRTFYLNNGFSDVNVRTASHELKDKGLINLDFRIAEHKQRVVEKINITGTQHTTKALVRKQLALSPGQVLDNEKLGKSVTRLYRSGAYSGVDFVPQETTEGGSGLKPYQEPVTLQVKLHEVPPWELSYGGYYDTDRGPGGVLDLSNHNMIGGARTIGLRGRYDDLYRGATVYLTQPRLHRFFPRADLAGYITRDQRKAFVAKTLGLSFQQEVPLQNHYLLTYGYRLERDITISLDPTDTSLNSRQRIAPLNITLTRETRNDILDATRGMFVSSNFEVGTKYFGSQVHYVRYVGQYFQYVPLSRPVSVPFSSSKRSRLVWASGIRIGLESGLGGQEVNPSQRFFAGGGTTIRGFGQDEVGPKDSQGQPIGGNAVFILNQEIRFPLFSIFEGTGFLDLGNVYPLVSDFNPFKVRSAAGLGLLIRTPIVPIRVDYGFKLDRHTGESIGQLFIGIGQAF